MTGKILRYTLLWPLSKIYGWVTAVRNFLFDKNILLHQTTFEIPVVVVGNINIGGTGKTPHTEYLVSKLMADYKVAVLSRGYKRRTHGFVLASPASHPSDIGDEPYQIFRKFGGSVPVAVCEDRVAGIRKLRELFPDLNMVVLDDAFQHRYVKPTVSMVLTEYSRPPYHDRLLPLGRLRESPRALNRADIVVVTKCPDDVKPMDMRVYKERLNLFPYQKLYFSTFSYCDPVPVFPEAVARLPRLRFSHLTREDILLSVTGVANPRPFVRFLRRQGARVKVKCFDDHHAFTESDMESILRKFNEANGRYKYIVTTEKDAVRLAACPYFPPALREYIYYIPVQVRFLDHDEPLSPEDAVRQIVRTADICGTRFNAESGLDTRPPRV